MTSWSRQVIPEDIPLINYPWGDLSSESNCPSGSNSRKALPVYSYHSTNIQGSMRGKPVPVHNNDSHGIVRSRPSQHLGYSTLSGLKEEESYHSDESTAATKGFATKPVVWPIKPITFSDQAENPKWLPYALQLSWLLILIAFGLLILALVSILHYRSVKHTGLISDSGSPALYFAWRFMPTLVAVSYVTILMIILDAVKRTEAFARLTSSHGASADASIFREPGAWWTTIVDSFPRKQNGSRFSVGLLFAAVAYLLGLFVISPFSSALLQVKQVPISTLTPFDIVQIDSGSPLFFETNALDYAQTMAHVLQNVTTSPWIAGQYTVVPFWPNREDRPNGARIGNLGKSWEANTTIFKSEMTYEVLQLTSNTSFMKWSYTDILDPTKYIGSLNLTSYIFSTQTGCQYGLGFDPLELDVNGFLFWSTLSNVTVSGFWDLLDSFAGGDLSTLLNHSSQCEPGEVLIIIPPANATFNPWGYLFRPSYYSATLPVTVVPTSDATYLRFDESAFNQTRTPVTTSLVNTTSFDDLFLSVQWNNFMVNPTEGNGAGIRALAGGPANVLAALYEFQVSSMREDPTLFIAASQVRQQFFGRVLQTSLQNISTADSSPGKTMKTESRVVVTLVVAVVLEGTLFTIICLLLVLVWFTRPFRRPLGVSQDPAFVNTIASLMPPEPDAKTSMNVILSTGTLKSDQKPDAAICKLVDHKLVVLPADKSVIERQDLDNPGNTFRQNVANWSPGVLANWAILSLALFLSILIATIGTLYWYSIVHGLSQQAFTYQATIESNTHSIGNIAPYSIIPTLLGVISGLWWGAIEGVFRSVQPFIAMTRRPTASDRGSGLSYQSSYLAWASVRSMSRGHWLLALICAGAFLSQIFTISMSALWQPVSDGQNYTQAVDQPFQLREVPRLYVASNYHITPQQQILPDLFQNFTSNWLYGAFSQLTVNASEPSWSRDGWSFVPVSLSDVSQARQESKLPEGHANANVTVTVPAIRGRLECVPLAPNLDTRYYTMRVNISDFNATGRPLPPSEGYYSLGCTSSNVLNGIYVNFDPNTTTADNCAFMQSTTALLAAAVPPTCCGWDESGLPEKTMFSYWTPVLAHDQYDQPASLGFDIAVKTFYGSSPAPYYDGDDWISLLWPEPPSLAMLRCSPTIETASSTVTVDVVTQQVQDYTIHGPVVPYAPAWTDDFLEHQLGPGVDPQTFVQNYTVSFGPMFLSALMGAAQLKLLGGCADESGATCSENSDDQTFNYHAAGMNMDYMSYSMLSLASNNISAMLDPVRTIPLAQQVFTTFFQHFVSSDVPINGSGGWAYQRASETLPSDLMPPTNQTSNPNSKVGQAAPSTVTATISEPIEKLQMSPVAVYVCLGILVWLLVTTILILLLKKRYFSGLLQPTETIADVARLVVHSDCYLELANERGATGLKRDKTFRTKLGWFRSRDGEIRWGIELADDPRVDWLEDIAGSGRRKLRGQNS